MSRKASMPAKGRATPGERQIRFQRLLGLIFCAGGAVAIGFGWFGAARVTCVDCQVPYILSGGAAGLALIVFGAAMLVMAQLRTEGRRIAARLEQLALPAGRPARRPASTATTATPLAASDGHTEGARTEVVPAAGGVDVGSDGGDALGASGEVVAGPSTYHRASCRLVQGKDELERMSAEEARDRGLSACRVCDPDRVDAPAADDRDAASPEGASESSGMPTASAGASTEEAHGAAEVESAPASGDESAPVPGDESAPVPGDAASRPGGFWRSRRRSRAGRRGEPEPAPQTEELGI